MIAPPAPPGGPLPPVRLSANQTARLDTHLRASRERYETDPTIITMADLGAALTKTLGFKVTEWAARMAWSIRHRYPITEFRRRASLRVVAAKRAAKQATQPSLPLPAPETPTPPDLATQVAAILERLAAIEKRLAGQSVPVRPDPGRLLIGPDENW